MVPGSGPESNRDSQFLAEWVRNSKGLSGGPGDIPDGTGFDQLFTALAEWNDYLENHVLYYRDGEHGGPEL